MWIIGWIVFVIVIALIVLGIILFCSKQKDTDDREQRQRITDFKAKQDEEMFKQRGKWNRF